MTTLRELPGVRGLGLDTSQESTTPRKVFAKPFRLCFTKREPPNFEPGVITWIEVKTLGGLKKVAQDLRENKLAPIDAFSTLDRQLWGHLAEHVGFLRYAGPEGDLHGGIQAMGAETAELADTLSDLFGGIEDGFKTLGEMRDSVVGRQKPVTIQPSTGQFIKTDGVNLTPEGEETLLKLCDMASTPEAAKRVQAEQNAAVLVDATDPGKVGDPVTEIDAELKEAAGNLTTFIGPEADDIGSRVEDVGQGLLDDDSTDDSDSF